MMPRKEGTAKESYMDGLKLEVQKVIDDATALLGFKLEVQNFAS